MFELENHPRRHAPEPDLVPIMDGLTAVIFFLLLSVSFVGMTKLTVPPSSLAQLNSNDATPLSPIVRAAPVGGKLVVRLEWLGEQPSQLERAGIVRQGGINIDLKAAAADLAKEFKALHPQETSLQISLDPNMPFQELISLMDGLREHYQDLVLSSYSEVP